MTPSWRLSSPRPFPTAPHERHCLQRRPAHRPRLAGAGQADILRGLFSAVHVTPEVKTEVEAGGVTGRGAALFQSALWLRVTPLHEPPDPALTALLDIGEASTIALARQESASLILLDEVKGRHVARQIYGLPVIGTARLLVEAKRAGLIPNVQPVLHQMRTNGYWIADRIVAEILRQAGE